MFTQGKLNYYYYFNITELIRFILNFTIKIS